MYPFVFTLISVLALCLSSCKSPIDIPNEDVRQALTVLCVANNHESEHQIRTSRTNIGGFTPVADAQIDLRVDGVSLPILPEPNPKQEGSYLVQYAFQPKQELVLTVKQGGYRLEAKATMPDMPTLGEVSTEDYQVQSGYGGPRRRTRWSIKLKDKPAEKNYYRIEIHEELVYRKQNTSTYYILGKPLKLALSGQTDYILSRGNPKTEAENSSDFNIDDVFGNSWGNPYNIFSDELFDGQEVTVKPTSEGIPRRQPSLVITRPDDTNGGGGGVTLVYVAHRYKVLLQALSEDTYRYYLSLGQSKTADTESPFATPIQVHSNIKGGAGILGVCTTTKGEVIKRFYGPQP